MHIKAKAQIKECYEKKKSGDPNYSSLTTSMNIRLRQTVGETHWKVAHDYLDHFLQQKMKSKGEKHRLSPGGSGQQSTTTIITTTPEQKAAMEKKKAEDDKVKAEKKKARKAANRKLAEQKKRKEAKRTNLNHTELIKQKIIDLGDIDLIDDDLDEVIKTIEQNTVLEKLGLGDNKLTLADGKLANAIAKNTTLKVLDLHNNKILPEGMKQLADALKSNNALQELDLSRNKIGSEGAQYVAEMLAVNETLQEIDLDNNTIVGPGVRELAETLEESNHSVKHLSLGGSNTTHRGYNTRNDPRYTQAHGRIDVVCKKNEKIVTLKQTIAKKDKELEGKVAEIAKGDIVTKDQENERLKKELADAQREVVTAKQMKATAIAEKEGALKLVASMKADITRKEEELEEKEREIKHMTSKPLIDKVDLTAADDNDDEPSSKRRKCIAGIVLEEKEKRLVKIKQEQVETRADLENVREDLDIANDTVTQQAVFTDAWQSKFDELAAIAQAQGVDGRAISEIRNRSITS